MVRPSIARLPEHLLRGARHVATALRARGQRAWLVGGAVRDLALGCEAHDVDLATAAHPVEIEATFPRAIGVGRAFGTLLLPWQGLEIQVTTFRAEGGYRDARRPDEVLFGSSLEEDARRRDFTCNALFLDPLDDELADPTGGLGDLERRLLRCVGDPAQRFAEDGLRILRLARFASLYGLQVEAATLAAAQHSLASLRGVSAERVLGELERMASRPGAARAIELLRTTGALPVVLPDLGALCAGSEDPERDLARRLDCLAHLADPPGSAALLATLLDPGGPERLALGISALRSLRASGELVRSTQALWRGLAEIDRLLARERAGEVSRAARVRLVREPEWPVLARLWRARRAAHAHSESDLAPLEEFAARTPREALLPERLVTSADLLALGLPHGPRWGELLRQAEDLQLEGLHTERAQALAWLARAAHA
jgi:tRNA nucleotidyltransferase/poly(A) polymerase